MTLNLFKIKKMKSLDFFLGNKKKEVKFALLHLKTDNGERKKRTKTKFLTKKFLCLVE